MIIIGITGTLGAGKGTVVEYLQQKYSFVHYSARDYIVEEIERRNLPVNRDTMTEVSNSLRAEHGSAYIIGQLYGRAIQLEKNAIIESVRAIGEVELLKEKAGAGSNFYFFAVDADARIRYDRIQLRKSSTDHISFDKFLEDEKREMESSDPNKQNLKYCIMHSDCVFRNDGALEELYTQIDAVMKKLIK